VVTALSRRALVASVVTCLAAPAHADAPAGAKVAPVLAADAPTADAAPAAARRALALGAAVVPGPLLAGSGSFVRGDRRSARGLVRLQLLGLALVAATGAPLAATYGSRRLAATIPVLLGGTGLWMAGWFGDLFVTVGGDASDTAPRRLPARALAASTVLALDPLRGARAYAALDGELAVGGAGGAAARLRASVWTSVERAEQRARVELELPVARRHRARDLDDSHAALLARVHAERNLTGQVDSGAADLALRLHLDGVRVAPALRGTFAEAELGLGLTVRRYSPGGVDVADALVARLAWGRRLGDGGELRAFYDHRRDGLAGGLHASRATGFVGSIGAAAVVPLARGWDVVGAVELGSALVTTAGLRRSVGAGR
jgi:hypothetical protein